MSQRKSPEDKLYAIAGSVTMKVLNSYMRESKKRGISLASLVGESLGVVAEGFEKEGIVVDERQERLPYGE